MSPVKVSHMDYAILRSPPVSAAAEKDDAASNRPTKSKIARALLTIMSSSGITIASTRYNLLFIV